MTPESVRSDEFLDLEIRDSRWGKLGPLTFPSLIHNVCDERNTGVLTVKDAEIEKNVYVERGRVVFATSNLYDDRLGSLLFRKGTIPLREIEDAANVCRKTGRRLGGILVERQVIRPQDLIWGVREQVKEIVVSLFNWTRGDYHFVSGPFAAEEVITLKMSTGDMVLEGVKRIESWSRVQLAVGAMRTRYQVTPRLEEIGRAMTLSLDEWTMLSRCEGPVTLEDLCGFSSMKDFDICRLVWAFSIVGILTKLE
jgi:uncharacterized protein DUF4388